MRSSSLLISAIEPISGRAHSSIAVGITDLVVEACRGRAEEWSIDPVGRPPTADVSVLAAKAEEALPIIAERLGGALEQ